MKHFMGATIITPTDCDIVITREFDAPRAVLFEAWTRVEHVAHWWDPSGEFLAKCEIDLRVNGHYHWVNRGENGDGHAFSGSYKEIIPPEKLVFTVQMFSEGTNPVATLMFEESNKKTTLTITMSCSSSQDRDAMLQMRIDEGTARTLGNLAAYLPKILATI